MQGTFTHAAVWACAAAAFYGVARLGEVTTRTLQSFDASKHVTPSCLRPGRDRNDLIVTVLSLPITKTAPDGEDIYWARQVNGADPDDTMLNHLSINAPRANEHLFTHTVKGQCRPLSHACFLQHVNTILCVPGSQPIYGHGFRIGGTLEYLLCGIPFEAVKAKGRWASDAFHVYLRQHAQILAPHMQPHPELHTHFLQYTIPSVN
ncbi:hypothetical protein EWM64_g9728 [Hericium alpestre]|uniref:Uncharacterized protein n=1 Tax=Hericium alpestre TaxID=135208 RepID=A0A4Y9ZIK8_9AGAM|nr:hypothetical protein EWM64_g9728 [Hericium alpestre]